MSEDTLQSIMTYILERNLRLWVLKKSDQFVHDSILLALYKDLFAVGYKKLFGSVKKWLNCSDRSLRHNTQVLRSHLAQWGREDHFGTGRRQHSTSDFQRT